MPLADRPVAFGRLQSADLENPFFRAWALKGQEDASATRRSRGVSSESIPTSSVSPFTQEPERRFRSTDRRKLPSESSFFYSSSPPRTPPLSSDPTYSPSITIYAEPSILRKRASNATLYSGEISTRPFAGSKARKVLGFPDTRTSPEAPKKPLRPHHARYGPRWMRTNSGHWLETLIKKEGPIDTSQANLERTTSLIRASTRDLFMDDDGRDGILLMESPASEPLKIVDSNSAVSIDPMFYNNPSDPFHSSDYPKEGLYCRTKRALRLKNDPMIRDKRFMPNPERAKTGGTGLLLNSTSNALRFLVTRGHEPTSSSLTSSNRSIASPRAASHWPHLRPGLASSIKSSSSSLRSLMKRQPQPPSPEPRSMYTGSDKNQYFSVELTDADAPAFLPSEARRITTPPLGTCSTPASTNLRSFFHEYSLPQSAEETFSISQQSTFSSHPITSSKGSRTTSITALPMPRSPGEMRRYLAEVPIRKPETEWYRVQMHAISGYGGLIDPNFLLSVPDHLPNSPMCPKHPKNKSGGKGLCVTHGRNLM